MSENIRTPLLPPLTEFALRALILLHSYREPMAISRLMRLQDGSGYYLCPRCSALLERDFVNFCSSCGQALGWKHYRRSQVIYPPNDIDRR